MMKHDCRYVYVLQCGICRDVKCERGVFLYHLASLDPIEDIAEKLATPLLFRGRPPCNARWRRAYSPFGISIALAAHRARNSLLRMQRFLLFSSLLFDIVDLIFRARACHERKDNITVIALSASPFHAINSRSYESLNLSSQN